MNDKQKKWIEENLPAIQREVRSFKDFNNDTKLEERAQLIMEALGMSISQERLFIVSVALRCAHDWYLTEMKPPNETPYVSQVIHDKGQKPE